ncbi:MAG: hypothetical protein ACRDQZ_17810, partial [Mycobacteriales bacterium]
MNVRKNFDQGIPCGKARWRVDSVESAAGRARVAPTSVPPAASTADAPVSVEWDSVTKPSGRARVPPRPLPEMNAPVSAGPAREATPYPEVTQPSGWQSAWPAPPAPALPADALSAAAPAVKQTGGEPAGMPRALAAASVLLAINLLLSVVAALGSLLISDELVRLSLGREPLDSDHATV